MCQPVMSHSMICIRGAMRGHSHQSPRLSVRKSLCRITLTERSLLPVMPTFRGSDLPPPLCITCCRQGTGTKRTQQQGFPCHHNTVTAAPGAAAGLLPISRTWSGRGRIGSGNSLPGGGPRGLIALARARAGRPGRMDGLLHRAERLGRCRATFRQVSQGSPAGTAFQAAAGHRCGDHRSRQTAVEAGIRVHDPGRHAIPTRVPATATGKSGKPRW